MKTMSLHNSYLSHQSMKRGLSVIAVLGLTLSFSAGAFAFCRKTACVPATDVDGCLPDPVTGCYTKGAPLAWPQACVPFAVQQDGSPKLGITSSELRTVAIEAARSWISVDCGEFIPSIGIAAMDETVSCQVPTYNKGGAPNSNTIMFRDNDWPHGGGAATIQALTTVTYNVESGAILDADIELNSENVTIKTDGGLGPDLQALLTHEFGHFLGFDHSDKSYATMYEYYGASQIKFRELADDDVEAMCTVYGDATEPPSCQGAQPLHGFTSECLADSPPSGGCQLSPLGQPEIPSSTWWFYSFISISAGLRLLRRSKQS